jgi:hypothetical protein
MEVCNPHPRHETAGVNSPSVFALLAVIPGLTGNRKFHENLGVRFFAEQLGAPTQSFDTKLADVWNPVVLQFGRYLH